MLRDKIEKENSNKKMNKNKTNSNKKKIRTKYDIK
jgi:hypothetical protein